MHPPSQVLQMRRADRHVGEHPRRRHDSFIADLDNDLAFENVESFFFPTVDVRGWAAARRHDCFPQGVLAVDVLPGRQEAVHVADDGDGPAFAGLSQGWSVRHVHSSGRRLSTAAS